MVVDTVDAEDGIQIAAVVVVVVESWGLVAEHKAAQKVLRNRAVFDPSIMHKKKTKSIEIYLSYESTKTASSTLANQYLRVNRGI